MLAFDSPANLGARPRGAILKFCCDNLAELSQLASHELDKNISSMHKVLASHGQPARRVRLNGTKCILLQAIRVHFQDR